MAERQKKDTLLLVDANSLIYRAFHALPPFRGPDGQPTGALYGLASILLKVFRERPPQYAAAAFDRPEPTFRKIAYEEYKATRPPAPDELVSQVIEAHRLLEVFGIRVVEEAGWEADDLLAALVRRFAGEAKLRIVIVTGDLDLLQLVKNDKVVVEVPRKGISETVIYNEEAVRERFGVSASQLADYKGLVGDASDNIPGVPGIGPKTAGSLIQKYGRLENLYREIDEVGLGNQKIEGRLRQYRDQAFLSKKLATLAGGPGLDLRLVDLRLKDFRQQQGEVIAYLQSLGFESLVKRVNQNFNQREIVE
jgi:DNA polymerase-1